MSRDDRKASQVETPEQGDAKDIVNREFLTKKLAEFTPTGDYLETTGGAMTGNLSLTNGSNLVVNDGSSIQFPGYHGETFKLAKNELNLAKDWLTGVTFTRNGITYIDGELVFKEDSVLDLDWQSYIKIRTGNTNRYPSGIININRSNLENIYEISNAISVDGYDETWIKTTNVKAYNLNVQNVTAESADTKSLTVTSKHVVQDSTGVSKKMRISANAYDTFSQIRFETGHINKDGSETWDIPGNTLNLVVGSNENPYTFQSYNVFIPWPEVKEVDGDYFYNGTLALQEDIEKHYQKKINVENKLSTDLIDTENSSNKFITTDKLNQIDTNNNSIETIEKLIPSQATAENQLADKNFVNSSIATNTATFRGTFDYTEDNEWLNDEQVKKADNNDYVFIRSVDENGNILYTRHKFNGTTWIEEYTLNNSSFTSEQWATINSGITKTEVNNKLDAVTETYDGAQLLYAVNNSDGTTKQATVEYTSNAHSQAIPVRDGYANFKVSNRADYMYPNTSDDPNVSVFGNYVANYNYVDEKVANKQDTLISGSNIKTINNQSILGAGNITIATNNIEVDQTYNPTSTNAQSGTAVAEAISNIQTSVQSDWNETDTTSLAYIKNKPTISTEYNWEDIKNRPPINIINVGNEELDLNDYTTVGEYIITSASTIVNAPVFGGSNFTSGSRYWLEVEKTLGGNEIYQYITWLNWVGYRQYQPMDPNATNDGWTPWTEINLLEKGQGETQVQADWTETSTDSLAYIKNKPDLSTKQDKLNIQTTGWINNLSGLTLGSGWQYTYSGNDVPQSRFPLLTIGKTYLLNYELDIPLTDTVQEGKTYFATGDTIGIRNSLNTSVFELSNVHYQIASNGQPLIGAKAQFSCIYKQDRPAGTAPENTTVRVSAEVFSSKDITNPVSLRFKITAIQLD